MWNLDERQFNLTTRLSAQFISYKFFCVFFYPRIFCVNTYTPNVVIKLLDKKNICYFINYDDTRGSEKIIKLN